jgi:amino acid adenylation domain-containing protein
MVRSNALHSKDQCLDNKTHSTNAAYTEIENILIGIWSDVLKIDHVSIDDNFFKCGGDSLRAIQFVSRINSRFKVDMHIQVPFESSTIRELAAIIPKLSNSEENMTLRITKINRDKSLPLSFTQQRLWFLHQYDPQKSYVYNSPTFFYIHGNISIPSLEDAINKVIMRHEILRTKFKHTNEGYEQIAQDDYKIELRKEIAQSEEILNKIINEEIHYHFDLEVAPPFRCRLIKQEANKHLFIVNQHHIICDAWSLDILIKEISTFYTAKVKGNLLELPPLTIQYVDFAVWQKENLRGERLNKHVSYWKKQLKNINKLNLPTNYPRPPIKTFAGNEYIFEINKTLVNKLENLAQIQNTSLFILITTIIKILLSRYSNQMDICIGTPIANRNHEEIENLLGCFVNTLVIRSLLDHKLSFIELLDQVTQTTLEAYMHQDMPFEELVNVLDIERDISSTPLFQVMIAMQNFEKQVNLSLPETKVERLIPKYDIAKFDLTFGFQFKDENLVGIFEYNTDLFKLETIAQIANDLLTLMIIISNNSGLNLKDLIFPVKNHQLYAQKFNIELKTAIKHSIDERINNYWDKQIKSIEQANDLNALLSKVVDLDNFKSIGQPEEVSIQISGGLYQELKQLAKQQGVTINTIAQFAWHKLIQTYTRDKQTIVGTTVPGRHIPAEKIKDDVSLHVSILPLIVDWINLDQITIAEQLRNIHQQLVKLNEYSDVNLANKLQHGTRKLFHSLFVSETFPASEHTVEASKDGEINIKLRELVEELNYPLGIIVYEYDNSLKISIKYGKDYVMTGKIIKLLGQVEIILQQMLDVNNKVSNINLLTSEEYQKIIFNYNQTDREYLNDKTIYQLFEEQVEKTPNNIAVVFEKEKLTYRELNERANQLGGYLRNRYKQTTKEELKADTLIALFLDRDHEMIIAILGVLKAGGAYVPIDPSYPKVRIKYLINDAKTNILITQNHLKTKLEMAINENVGKESFSLVIIDDKETKIDLKGLTTTNLEPVSKAIDLAYVIYTSGTTGVPKGVMVEHNSLCMFIRGFIDKLQMNKINLLSSTNYIFDIFSLECFLPIVTSGTLYLTDILNFEKNLEKFYPKINLLQQTPSVWQQVMDNINTQYTDGVTALTGGETLSLDVKKRLHKCFKEIFNVYGPTETVIWSTIYKSSPNNQLSSLIGKPLPNERVYILDSYLTPVPVGVLGELYIGGAGLARGYLNQPETTQERFISNPFATEEDIAKGYTRLYKTGDLVRWLPDGNVEYIERNDFQVKIQGFRVELGEIENAISKLDKIKQVTVQAKERQTNTGKIKRLVAYYVSRTKGEITPSSIIEHLNNVLPKYMVPNVYIELESLPLTENGKLNSKALPDPKFMANAKYVPPRTELEAKLCSIWAEIMKIERVGVDDDFFDLGGHSMLALHLIATVNKRLNIKIKIAELYSLKTIKHIASSIELEQTSKLILPLNNYNKQQKTLFMIHPANGGCEVYKALADELKEDYLCYGIDNYNLYHDNKIENLTNIAKVYLKHIKSQCGITQHYNLLGWSLGGQISMEIACLLEKEGVEQISIFLLDTIMPDNFLKQMWGALDQNKYASNLTTYLLSKGYDDNYIRKIISAMPTETVLANTDISNFLRYAKVFLFKALQVSNDEKEDSEDGKFSSYIVSVKDNNISRYTNNLTIISMDVSHNNILQAYSDIAYNMRVVY